MLLLPILALALQATNAQAAKPVPKRIRYEPFDLGGEEVRRTVWVENGHAVLELRFPPLPAGAPHFRVTDLSMMVYDTLTSLPALLPRKKGVALVARFLFPPEAAKVLPLPAFSGRLNLECTFEGGEESQASAAIDEENVNRPDFTPGNPVRVGHALAGRTLELQVLSATKSEKPLPGFPLPRMTLEAGKPLPVPGLVAASSKGSDASQIIVAYRFRFLPNVRWRTGETPIP